MITAPKLRNIVEQFLYLPQTLSLVWAAAKGLTIIWAILLVIQAIVPVVVVCLSRLLVDTLVATIGSGSSWERAQPLLILIICTAGVMLLTEVLQHALAHGAAALCMVLSLGAALRARRHERPPAFAAAGVGLGLLLATEPASSGPIAVVVALLAGGASARRRAVAWVCAGALPGVLWLLVANHAATGHAFLSPADAYLAHSSPLPARAPDRAWAAFGTVVRRLRAEYCRPPTT